MNRLLVVIVLIVACVIGAGFYFGVLRIGTDSAGGMTHVTLTWDRAKMQEDKKKAAEKLHELTHQGKE